MIRSPLIVSRGYKPQGAKKTSAKYCPIMAQSFYKNQLLLRKTKIYLLGMYFAIDLKIKPIMLTFLLWLILFIICWPIAILALILYPFVWLLLLPFRLLGFAIELSFDLVKNIFMLPFRLVGVK